MKLNYFPLKSHHQRNSKLIDFASIKYRNIKNSIVFITFLSSLIFLTANLFSQEKRIVFVLENQRRFAIIKTFGIVEYFALIDQHPTIKSKARHFGPYLFFGTDKVSFLFLAGSLFFETITHFNQTFVSQMNLPAIAHSNKIFVPLNSFLQALNSIKFLECTTYKDKIVIRLIKQTFAEKPKTENKVSFDTKIHSKQEKLKQSEVLISNASNQIPKFIQSSIDYFLLNPSPENSSFKPIQKTGIKKDTAVNIPPKYYVLPSILKDK